MAVMRNQRRATRRAENLVFTRQLSEARRKANLRPVANIVLVTILIVTTGCEPQAESPPASDDRAALTYVPPKLQPLSELASLPRGSDAEALACLQEKPALVDFMSLPLNPRLTPEMKTIVANMHAGHFRPSGHFDWREIGVPPPWDDSTSVSNTWDLWRHALLWIQPLVTAWLADGDTESGVLVQRILRDWVRNNAVIPGASQYAWSDHASAERLQVLCWTWELYRRSNVADPEFAVFLMHQIETHADFVASGETYHAESNHGLIQNVALLMAAVTVPEFRKAAEWRRIAAERMTEYARENFTNAGFHREQSPGYHWFVLQKFGNALRFLRLNGQPTIEGVERVARRAATVWPYLIRPNGIVANIGDTWERPVGYWPSRYADWWGDDIPAISESTAPNPRKSQGAFLMDFDAGYAAFTSYALDCPTPKTDTYMLFKCNAFVYTHYHHDALSFILYGQGRDWLVDSGLHSYREDSSERLYVRGPRGHNLVLVDNAEFELGEVELIDHGRTAQGDFVVARHHLPNAMHTRELLFTPPHTIRITDELTSTDANPHAYAQLFHVAPGLQVELESNQAARLVAEDGATCTLEQSGAAGAWQVIEGQKEPFWQGWYSPGFEKIEPAPVLIFTSDTPAAECEFQTTITLHRPEE